MPFFDPADFWDAVQRLGCTWYYAAPTMHASIVSEAEARWGVVTMINGGNGNAKNTIADGGGGGGAAAAADVSRSRSRRRSRGGGSAPSNRVRLMANAAGPLTPAAAEALRACFPGAAVLPCYGMTECMPITCPPPGYALERPGSCGQAVGPELSIRAGGGP